MVAGQTRMLGFRQGLAIEAALQDGGDAFVAAGPHFEGPLAGCLQALIAVRRRIPKQDLKPCWG